MQKHKPRSGLGIKASIVRYGDPGVLLDLPAKVRAWRAAGSPKHLILLPEVIYGAEAVSQNRRSRAGRALYEDSRKAWRRILRDVVTKLLDARLVAYGSFDSSLNTEELIPAAAWKHLSLHDLKRSTLREGKREKRRLIYSVRIYPPLEASCAPDLMIDQSIVSVIKQHVLNDPEVTSLIDRMGGDGKLAEQFVRRVPLGTCGGNDFPAFRGSFRAPKDSAPSNTLHQGFGTPTICTPGTPQGRQAHRIGHVSSCLRPVNARSGVLEPVSHLHRPYIGRFLLQDGRWIRAGPHPQAAGTGTDKRLFGGTQGRYPGHHYQNSEKTRPNGRRG